MLRGLARVRLDVQHKQKTPVLPDATMHVTVLPADTHNPCGCALRWRRHAAQVLVKSKLMTTEAWSAKVQYTLPSGHCSP